MKAGIYRTPNGNLIYVAKDRTIKANTLSPSSWPGTKVKTEANGARVVVDVGGSDHVCHRVADVPNGCTDPQAALTAYLVEVEREIVAIFGEGEDTPETLALRDKIEKIKRAEDPDKPRISGCAAQLLLQEGKAEEMIEAIHANLIARGAVHVAHGEYMLPKGAGKSGFATGGPVGIKDNEVPAILSRGQCIPATDRTEEKTARLSAGAESGVPEAWRNVKNADQYKDLQFEMERVAMQARGFRLCHAKSARKHKKNGDDVRPSGHKPGAYYWRAKPTQRTVLVKHRFGTSELPEAI
jgi:hypothetical protein